MKDPISYILAEIVIDYEKNTRSGNNYTKTVAQLVAGLTSATGVIIGMICDSESDLKDHINMALGCVSEASNAAYNLKEKCRGEKNESK